MSEGTYLTDDREGQLLAAVLVNLDSTDKAQRRIADLVIAEFIELGLCDPDRGPQLFQFWIDNGEDYIPAEELAQEY